VDSPNLPISVLLSIYIGDQLEFVRGAVNSILSQSGKPKQLVIVLDGPIDQEVRTFLDGLPTKYPSIEFSIIPQCENCGLASALNEGLKYVKQPYVARMDADDVSNVKRFEEQFAYMKKHKLDVVGCLQGDFYEDPNKIVAIKKCPERHADIKEALKWRAVVSHPSIIAKKKVFEKCSGYRPSTGNVEDHDLFVRAIMNGFKFGCVQEVLMYVRLGNGQRERRGGFRFLKYDWHLRHNMYRSGFTNIFQFLTSYILVSCFKLTPFRIRKFFYKFVRVSQ